MRFIISIAVCILTLIPFRVSAEKPTLVVNIVVSQLRYDHLIKYSKNFSNVGFRRFMDEGIVFSEARYNFMQSITPATLATFTTGADPATHGIVSERWVDYTNNRRINLIDDSSVKGLDCDAGIGQYSYVNITVPTLGDKLLEENPDSKVITIAADPLSAIVMGGRTSRVFWMDNTRGSFVSSTGYGMSRLPDWVSSFNNQRLAAQYLDYRWTLSQPKDRYINSVYSLQELSVDRRSRRLVSMDFLKKKGNSKDYPAILYTPGGNRLVAEFAKMAIEYNQLGRDAETDILNICFDSPRYIAQLYGIESIEYEDMLYRLDDDIASIVSFISGMTDMRNVVIVLTSDHGASDSFDYGNEPRERFNSDQFRVIINGFMNAQYGAGEWVTDYCDRQLYLNRNLIYTHGLNIEDVQNRVAAFALQFRGVSHVLTSTALQNSSFGSGYAEKMQNSFYPKRSGDLTINLMPGWIEEREGVRSASGSMYDYDTHVPLMILNPRLSGHHVSRPLNMRDVAPTLARIMEISRPIAAEGELIDEIIKLYR